MIKNEYKIVGVMSGTSLDGIDLALITFKFDTKWAFKINAAETIAYTKEWRSKLMHLIDFSKVQLQKLDNEYTLYLADVIEKFIKKNNIVILDAVCTHGHTALHIPQENLTYQIGNLPILAKILKQTIVCDFRVQDVALGGQGAPLVPIGDALLFQNYNYCLNLGGFANVSTEINGSRIAFDICPVNIILNKYVSKLGFNYDNQGNIAKKGTINKVLLNQLNKLQFYKETYPKSLGLEWVKATVFPIIDSYNLSVSDVLRTVVEHIAIQISLVINQTENATVLVTGGGVFNLFLMSRVMSLSKNFIKTPSNEIVEFKEALIFGLLGVLKLREENNCLSSVTGASKNHSSGKIFFP